MTPIVRKPRVADAVPAAPGSFARDVLDGLSRLRKTVPAQWLYDARGSALFEEITELPEYYPTRTEIAILSAHAAEMGALLGLGAVLVELGSGSSVKTEIVLAAMTAPAQYLAIDISASALEPAAARLRTRFPDLLVTTHAGDFTTLDGLPETVAGRPRHVFFPGSTLGNFEPPAARALLARFARLLSADGRLLVGIDLRKSLDVLLPAYDDAAGVTAAFNLNLLTRINRELAGTFDASAVEHRVRYEPIEHRIEMHLVATRAHRVRVLDRTFDFQAGESIHTENSYKYSLDAFATLAAAAGLSPVRHWTDERRWFAVVALRRT